MPNLFVDASDEFVVKVAVACAKEQGRDLYCDLTAEDLKREFAEEIDPATVEEHEVWFRFPDYGTATAVFNKSIELDGADVKVNFSAVRLNRMTTLLKRWTFKDGKGKPVPATAENVKRLSPSVAAMIAIQMDKQLDR